MPWWTSYSFLCRHFCSCLSSMPFHSQQVAALASMPGPHIEMKFMQTFSDVGGCDCWIGSCWEGSHQWWVGWRSPITTCSNGGSAGTPLIGYERWHCLHRGEPKVLEAFYAIPKPSFHAPPLPLPDGHWHIVWSHHDHRKWQQGIDSPLVVEENVCLKGGCTGPKCNYHTEGKGQGKSTGM